MDLRELSTRHAPTIYEHMFAIKGRPSLTCVSRSGGQRLRAVPRVIAYAGVGLAEAVTMASVNPARLLRIETGPLALGPPADLVVVQYAPGAPAARVCRTIVAGETVWEAAATA